MVVYATWRELRNKKREHPPASAENIPDEKKETGKKPRRIPQALKTLFCCSKRAKVEDATNVHYDRHLEPTFIFQRLLAVILSTGKANHHHSPDAAMEEEYFKYELCSHPASLFDSHGAMWMRSDQTEIMKLVAARCKFDPAACLKPPPGDGVVYFVDGRYLLRQLPWTKNEPFSGILERYLAYVKNRYGSGSVLVFDGCNGTESIRDKLAHKGPEVHFAVDAKLTEDKEEFLSNKLNRIRFLDVLAAMLYHNGYKILNVNKGDADYVLVTAVLNAATIADVVVVGDDTDEVLLLLLHFWNNDVNKSVYVSSITESDPGLVPKPKLAIRTWNIAALQGQLNPEVTSRLLSIHALLGSSTTSRLFGVGKEVALKLLETDETFRSYVDFFLNPKATHEEVELAGEAALLMIYEGADAGSLVSYRYRTFKRRVITTAAARFIHPQVIPPSSAAAKQHSYRAFLQVIKASKHQLTVQY